MTQHSLKLHVDGPFVLEKETGEKVELRGMRDKAIIALLALSPNHLRSRRWIVDKLWSDRFPEQGRTSLRQEIRSLRKALGPDHAAYLVADRTSVGLACTVNLIRDETAEDFEMFEDIDVRDPEFDDWLREQRMADERQAKPKREGCAPELPPSHLVSIALMLNTEDVTREETMVAETLLDHIAKQLSETGTVRPLLEEQGAPLEAANLDARVEIRCLATEGDWFANVRVTPRDRQFYAWTGRIRLPMKLSAIWEGPELAAFAARIQEGIVHTLSRSAPNASFLCLYRASQMLFSGSADRINKADQILESIVRQEGSAAALAWRGYARLTKTLEFNNAHEDNRVEARALVDEALGRAPKSALVNGLASIVYMKLLGDIDFGHHLAVQATTLDDHNVYALDALSQALFFRGEHDRSYHLSNWARQAATHTPNSFNWDMRSSLSALSLGRIPEALELARVSHLKAPHYRPALRYLFALSALEGDHAAAGKYRKLLTAQEPSFLPENMLAKDYPVETLRRIGLHEGLIM